MLSQLRTRAAHALPRLAVSLLAALILLIALPRAAGAASHVHLHPGRHDVGAYKGATNLYLEESGTYTLTGSSSSVMVYMADLGGSFTLVLDGLTLTPDNSAPGPIIGCRRSAITIADVQGASVQINVPQGTTSTLKGWNEAPALCKTGVKTALTFGGGGTLIARADPEAFRTAAIGCAQNTNYREILQFGNVTFNEITVYAYGSGLTSTFFDGAGGPAIGASYSGIVDGLTFNAGCTIYAYAGAADSAAIGTASGSLAWDPILHTQIPSLDRPCNHLTINGGTIVAGYLVGSLKACMGAGIGGGAYCSVNDLNITGGSVTVEAGVRPLDKTMWATGIGAGEAANANNITITGGTVVARGLKTGIGGGFFEVDIGDDFIAGDCHVHISGGDVTAAASEGVGIGGWMGKLPFKTTSGKGTVTISGGTVNASGGDGCGIGGGGTGRLSAINISGGTVIAQSNTLEPGADNYCAIGYNRGSRNKGRLKTLNITGGTVAALEGKGSMGTLDATNVYIGGGSVYAGASM